MTIRFIVKYSTVYGQAISININALKTVGQSGGKIMPLNYVDKESWQLEIDSEELGVKDGITYHYLLKNFGNTIQELHNHIDLNFKKLKCNVLEIHDEWRQADLHDDLYKTRPFIKLITQHKDKEPKKAATKNATHLFRVKAAEMAARYLICLTGSAKKMNGWNEEEPVMLHKNDGYWTAKLNLSKELFPIGFKIGLYDTQVKKIVLFEDGENRQLEHFVDDKVFRVYNILADFKNYAWRGAGINVQLSSIKTNRSWGTGDFTDLFLLSDWCCETGIKLIQLLPVNDTSATHTSKDSYPYSAISAFALHPNFLNVQKLATSLSVKFTAGMLLRVTKLNGLPVLDYEAVTVIKQEAIKLLFEKEKSYFKDDLDWFEFFDINRTWLQPYAAFCYLRDKYKTADFSQWEQYSEYDEVSIDELTSSEGQAYDGIAIHYFTQYHLHLQLKDATDYAHKNGLVLKADLPIGVGRCSVDTWMYPHLFHMDKQAGAPPDAFAVTGQNWSFPTYDWKSMSIDNYAWWRQRMEQLSTYFDAVRIDHVLGFFRIWSIPLDAIEGILGRFVPAHPLSAGDIANEGIHFNEDRLCNPYITNEILQQNFGDEADAVKSIFLDGFTFKTEYNTQRKVAGYFQQHPGSEWIKFKLFHLLSDVVLIRDEQTGYYHFRINIFVTTSFNQLGEQERQALDRLYNRYFFTLQEELWKEEGIKKIAALKNASNNMLLCGEDLGMVPGFVPNVLHDLEILSLQVERMPKQNTESFSPPSKAQYDCVVTPSTHDMSTLREWWEEDRVTTQHFYNDGLGHYGNAPFYCEPWIAKEMINQHLHSPSMWCVFLFQDLLAMDDELRRQDPHAERINIPADPHHVWNYRMHLSLETLLEATSFTASVLELVAISGR